MRAKGRAFQAEIVDNFYSGVIKLCLFLYQGLSSFVSENIVIIDIEDLSFSCHLKSESNITSPKTF